MINDTTHNFNPEHFDEGLYQEFRRSNYFNYTKFLEDRALEVEQARFNEQVARETIKELKEELEEVQDELDGEGGNRKAIKNDVHKLIKLAREIEDAL